MQRIKHYIAFLFLLLFAGFPALLSAQCSFSSTLTSVSAGSAFDNRTHACNPTWTVAFRVTGFTTLQFQIEGAADNNGSPGTYFPLVMSAGQNPVLQTGSFNGSVSLSLPANADNADWLRFNLVALTGSGSAFGSAIGSSAPPPPQPPSGFGFLQNGVGAIWQSQTLFDQNRLDATQFGLSTSGSFQSNTQALNNAIIEAEATGKYVFIPAGTYQVKNVVIPTATAITPVYHVGIIGESGTVLNCNTSDGTDCISAVATAFSVPVYDIENLQLIGQDTNCGTTNSGYGLRISGTAASPLTSVFRNIIASNFCGSSVSGIWFDSIENSSFYNIRSTDDSIGIKLSGSFNANYLSGIMVDNNLTIGLSGSKLTGNVFDALTLQSNVRTGMHLDNAVSNTFNSTYFENNNSSLSASTYALDLSASTGPVEANTFNSPNFTSTHDTINMAGVPGNLVTRNTFNSGISFAANPQVTENTFTSNNVFLNFVGLTNFSGYNGSDSICFLGVCQFAGYATTTNCSSAASPAVCGSAAAGSVSIAVSATSVVVDTTAVTANSQILVLWDSSLSSKLGITCNSAFASSPFVSARTPGTSFTLSIVSAPVTNPYCYSYSIIN